MLQEDFAKTWFITGITGQVGSILCKYLLSKGYTKIHGLIRQTSNSSTTRLEEVKSMIHLHYGDVTDAMSLLAIMSKVQPDFVVNLAAQSHVKVSSNVEKYTIETNTIGVLNLLQAVQILDIKCRVYQANSSETFGNSSKGMLNELSIKEPVSVYGVSKQAAHSICQIYKKAFGMFVVSGTLFNHESPCRGQTFVTQKIAEYVARCYHKGISAPLELGNLDAKRDWMAAQDAVDIIYIMLHQEHANDYVIATGQAHTVREFFQEAWRCIGKNVFWKGHGIDEKGYDSESHQLIVCVNREHLRDIEIHSLVGDASKAHKDIGWKPSISFEKIVEQMVTSSIANYKP